MNKALSLAALLAALFAVSSTLHAAAFTWVGASSSASWGSSTNWSSNAVPTFDNTADLQFPTSAVTNAIMNLGTNRIARSLNFGADVTNPMTVNYQSFNAGTGQNLTMSADSNNASITVAPSASGAITMGNNTGNTGTFGNLILSTNLDVIHNGTGLLLFNRPLTGAGVSLTKSGAGTMQLNNFNTNFTGVYNINGGTLVANASATNAGFDLDTASAVNLSNGTLQVRGNFGLNRTYTNVPINVNAASTLAWNNTNTAGTFALTISGPSAFALNANLVVANVSSNNTLSNLITISRNITGSGDLTNIGYNNITANTNNYNLGRLALSGTNTNWNGNLVVARGTVNLGGNGTNAPGNGLIILGSTADSFGAGLGAFVATSIVPLNSNIIISNNFIIRSGGFRSLRPSGDQRYTFTGSISLEGSLNVDSAFNFPTDKWVALAGNISGGGGLDITRSVLGGFVELSGSNSYTGPTTISNGAALQVNSPSGNAIGDTSAVGILGSTVFTTNSGVTNIFIPTLRVFTSETIGSLAAASSEARVLFSNNTVLTTGGDNSSTIYAGSSTGAGGVTKTGTGTMTLTGTNTHTGNTVINAGQIELGTNGSLLFVIGGNGTNNAVSGAGTALFRGTFNIDLTTASTNIGNTWTLVAGGGKTYDGAFQVAGFTNSGGTWTLGTNGLFYRFSQSSGVLLVTNTVATAYDTWVSYWQGLYPGFTNTARTDNPDGDPFNNNQEYAFDGNPAVGSPALLKVAKLGTNSIFSWVERNSGVTYQVQGTASLAAGPWTNTSGLTITNSADQSGISQTNDYTRKEFAVPAAGANFTRIQASVAP